MPARVVASVLLTGLASLSYVAAAHWLMTAAPPSPWNAVGVLAPMLAAAALGTWQNGQRLRSAGAFLLVALLCVQAANGVDIPAPLLYLAQHGVVHLALALWFAATLRDGAEPLIARLATRIHGRLTPAMRSYTRNVTRAWVLYFVAMVVVSVLVFVSAPFPVWAVFANLLTPLALVAMFIGERLLRYRLHPEFTRSSWLDAIRAYRHADEAADPTPNEPPA